MLVLCVSGLATHEPVDRIVSNILFENLWAIHVTCAVDMIDIKVRFIDWAENKAL